MSPAVVGLSLALLFALLDLAAPADPRPRASRRVLGALPAGVLAVTLRLCDAPPLPALALLAFAAADALALDGEEAGAGATAAGLLALLLLAAAVWELAAPALLAAEPWRNIGWVIVLAGGAALLRRRRPTGPLAPLAPLPAVLLAAAAAAVGAQPEAFLALPFAAALTLWSAASALRSWSGPQPDGLPRLDRALRSAAAVVFTLPLLPLPH